MQPSIFLQASSTKCRGRRSRYDKTCSFYMYSYIIVRIMNTYYSCINNWYQVLRNGHRLQQPYEQTTVITSIYMPLCTEHFTCRVFGTTTAVTTVTSSSSSSRSSSSSSCCCCRYCCCCCCCCCCGCCCSHIDSSLQ